jgi:hypothetical protein
MAMKNFIQNGIDIFTPPNFNRDMLVSLNCRHTTDLEILFVRGRLPAVISHTVAHQWEPTETQTCLFVSHSR